MDDLNKDITGGKPIFSFNGIKSLFRFLDRRLSPIAEKSMAEQKKKSFVNNVKDEVKIKMQLQDYRKFIRQNPRAFDKNIPKKVDLYKKKVSDITGLTKVLSRISKYGKI